MISNLILLLRTHPDLRQWQAGVNSIGKSPRLKTRNRNAARRRRVLSGKCFLFVPRVLHRVEFSHIVPERPTGTDYYAPAGCTADISFPSSSGRMKAQYMQRLSVTAQRTVTRNRASGNVGPADCDWCYHENRRKSSEIGRSRERLDSLRAPTDAARTDPPALQPAADVGPGLKSSATCS